MYSLRQPILLFFPDVSFEEVWDIMEGCGVDGHGPLAKYDELIQHDQSDPQLAYRKTVALFHDAMYPGYNLPQVRNI